MQLRKSVIFIGTLLVFLAILAFLDGNGKLSLLDSCGSLFSRCPENVSPGSDSLSVLKNAAESEMLYGAFFGGLGSIFLLLGLIGGRKRSNRISSE